jgi:hypothetical protein
LFLSFFSQFSGAVLLLEMHSIDKQICRFCSRFAGSGILIGESQLETLLMSHSKISLTTARDVAVPVQGCKFAGQWVKEEGGSYVSIMREGDV